MSSESDMPQEEPVSEAGGADEAVAERVAEENERDREFAAEEAAETREEDERAEEEEEDKKRDLENSEILGAEDEEPEDDGENSFEMSGEGDEIAATPHGLCGPKLWDKGHVIKFKTLHGPHLSPEQLHALVHRAMAKGWKKIYIHGTLGFPSRQIAKQVNAAIAQMGLSDKITCETGLLSTNHRLVRHFVTYLSGCFSKAISGTATPDYAPDQVPVAPRAGLALAPS